MLRPFAQASCGTATANATTTANALSVIREHIRGDFIVPTSPAYDNFHWTKLPRHELCASQFAAHSVRRGKEPRVPKSTQAVSIYYPFALVELLEIENTDEHAETGEVLLYFLDSDGCQVTVR